MSNPRGASLQGKRVVVGLSGGVDSAVAAMRLKQAGAEVIGVFMKNWEEEDQSHCTSEEDFHFASRVAQTLNIPLYSFNFAKDYWDRVFVRFLDALKQGLTPNPDIWCNREIKFDAFFAQARELGADFLATGHYAGLQENPPRLKRAKDSLKDQTYFLYDIQKEVLPYVLFPLATLTKSEVRDHAEQAGLANARRKDSTGICFIGERPFKQFLSQYIKPRPGPMVDEQGNTKGTHDGLMFYTLGQRQGLGIGGPGEPWFVAGKHRKTNSLLVVQGTNHPLLFTNALCCDQLNWLIETPPEPPFRCSAKVRYRQEDQPCTLWQKKDNGWTVHFDHPQRAVTPGQSVVFYDGDYCLGGGIIRSTSRDP